MTREEALKKAINIVAYFEAHFAKSKEAREDAANIIEALEQESCEDAISRQATIEAFQMFRGYEANRTNVEWVDRIETIVKKLPSVKQEPKTGHPQKTCDTCEHSDEIDGSNCYECVKDMRNNYSPKKMELKYCDRNICVSNEYNGIGCDECEVTKSQEPQESEGDE